MTVKRASKRRRVDEGDGTTAEVGSSSLQSMQRAVSPPIRTAAVAPLSISAVPALESLETAGLRPEAAIEEDSAGKGKVQDITMLEPKAATAVASNENETGHENEYGASAAGAEEAASPREMNDNTVRDKQRISEASDTISMASPFQLTQIRDLPSSQNLDTITLDEILGHPLLTECWQFNYLHSIPFIVSHFDPDIRPLVRLKIVHGFWRSDDVRRQTLQEQAAAVGKNVQLIAAHMPEPYGTHHSKMMVLLRADGLAQIVIHTANMIPQDWANLTQAVWRSPELPLLSDEDQAQQEWRGDHAIGTGLRFKADLLQYLAAYERRTRNLVDELKKYDFSNVRAALISSTPGKRVIENMPTTETAFGWPGLKQILSNIPTNAAQGTAFGPIINIQISSIATLTEKWIQNFLEVLRVCKKPSSKTTSAGRAQKPEYHIIFPTAEEIRQSLDGYSSGHSIHMKIQSAAQQKQLLILKPMLRHWHCDAPGAQSGHKQVGKRIAYRTLAAPHIKTYIRFSDSEQKTIDWAMITSANLSQQAWGFMTDKNEQVRIASYEIGVVVWPGLYKEPENNDATAVMVPTFGKDAPEHGDLGHAHIVVGLRMPYDLPLVPYANIDEPWCATMVHREPDRHGHVWGGYNDRM